MSDQEEMIREAAFLWLAAANLIRIINFSIVEVAQRDAHLVKLWEWLVPMQQDE